METIKLNFEITFKKGIAGLENEMYHANVADHIFCNDCNETIKERDEYYYWTLDEENDEASPAVDDFEYLLCTKCAKKRMKKE